MSPRYDVKDSVDEGARQSEGRRAVARYPGEHERIIDQNTWDRVHETLSRSSGDNGGSLKNKFGPLLRALLSCVPCGTPMMHTFTMRKSKRYRYYVCYNAQQQGWKNCETKSVPAQAIESAVLDSIRRIGTDPKLAEAVATEALDQVARRRREVDQESEAQRRRLRQLNQNLAREATDTSVDSGAWFERISPAPLRLHRTRLLSGRVWVASRSKLFRWRLARP
jgi:site-specific DNA recombinase